MKWTNHHNLDISIVRAVTAQDDDYRSSGDISVTGLLRPPQAAHLGRAYYPEMVQDVSEGLWLLRGKALHHVLEKGNEAEDALLEREYVMPLNGWNVSGRPDIFIPSQGVLKDYKDTSVWAFVFGRAIGHWQAQLNFYAAILRHNHLAVNKACIVAILRDWQGNRVEEDGDYPSAPSKTINIELWDNEFTIERMTAHLKDHQEGRRGKPRPCTDEERWASPDLWAVKKKGRKRAMRGGAHLADEGSARAFAAQVKEATELEFRPGGNRRCEEFCNGAPWCEQAKGLGVNVGAPGATVREVDPTFPTS